MTSYPTYLRILADLENYYLYLEYFDQTEYLETITCSTVQYCCTIMLSSLRIDVTKRMISNLSAWTFDVIKT